MDVLEKITDHKMIGILRGYETEETVKIVDAMVRNDFNVIEVALNSPDAKTTLRALKETFGEEIILGAGTVLTLEDAQECLDIGTEFLLSPVYSEEILKFSIDNNILYIPGCYTPTEIYNAHAAGAKLIKVFPAGGLKAAYIKDVLAPMNDLALLPTGGVTAGNINEFLRVGAQAAGVSSALVPSNREVDASMVEEIGRRIQNFKEVLDK